MAIIKIVWQLPQNLLGLLVWLVTSNAYSNGYYVWTFKSGLSLGRWIFINASCSMNTVKHEEGHQKQSLYLGWLYLIIIGLPSLVGAIVHRFVKFDYYEQPWEKWADELGGVDRSKSKW